MPNPTNPADERTTPTAEDDSTVINIPAGQVHPALANSPHPSQTQTFPVNVNGRVEYWTLEKLTAEAQTAAAGREKFQEAADLRKEAAKALAIQEDLELVFNEGDLDAFRRVGAAMGVPGDEVEAIAQNTFADSEGDEDDDDDDDPAGSYDRQVSRSKKSEARSHLPTKVDYSTLTPDLQRVMREAEQARIEKIVNLALDKDEKISYNMNAHDQAGRDAIRAYVDEKIRGRLDRYGGDFGDGTRILAEVLPEIREHLEALGTPAQRTHTGLGHSPGGGDTEVYPTKLPDHVPSTSGEAFEQNVLETMAYHLAQVERGKS